MVIKFDEDTKKCIDKTIKYMGERNLFVEVSDVVMYIREVGWVNFRNYLMDYEYNGSSVDFLESAFVYFNDISVEPF